MNDETADVYHGLAVRSVLFLSVFKETQAECAEILWQRENPEKETKIEDYDHLDFFMPSNTTKCYSVLLVLNGEVHVIILKELKNLNDNNAYEKREFFYNECFALSY